MQDFSQGQRPRDEGGRFALLSAQRRRPGRIWLCRWPLQVKFVIHAHNLYKRASFIPYGRRCVVFLRGHRIFVSSCVVFHLLHHHKQILYQKFKFIVNTEWIIEIIASCNSLGNLTFVLTLLHSLICFLQRCEDPPEGRRRVLWCCCRGGSCNQGRTETGSSPAGGLNVFTRWSFLQLVYLTFLSPSPHVVSHLSVFSSWTSAGSEAAGKRPLTGLHELSIKTVWNASQEVRTVSEHYIQVTVDFLLSPARSLLFNLTMCLFYVLL